MTLRDRFVEFLNQRGYCITRFPVRQFFDMHQFDTIFDVGANVGQYGLELRKKFGFKKQIVSFEPTAAAFSKLSNRASPDDLWTALHCGLGSTAGSQTINLAGNSASSSLFSMLPAHSDAAPGSAYVATETIEIKRLDDVFSQYASPDKTVLLKIDTQGYEGEVLAGAANSLNHIAALQLELSLLPLYEGAPLLEDIVAHVRDAGFVPYWFTHGFRNCQTTQLLQMDGFFTRPEYLTAECPE